MSTAPAAPAFTCICCDGLTPVKDGCAEIELGGYVCPDCKWLLRWAQAALKEHTKARGLFRGACPDYPNGIAGDPSV